MIPRVSAFPGPAARSGRSCLVTASTTPYHRDLCPDCAHLCPPTRRPWTRLVLAVVVDTVASAGCDDFPRDPDGPPVRGPGVARCDRGDRCQVHATYPRARLGRRLDQLTTGDSTGMLGRFLEEDPANVCAESAVSKVASVAPLAGLPRRPCGTSGGRRWVLSRRAGLPDELEAGQRPTSTLLPRRGRRSDDTRPRTESTVRVTTCAPCSVFSTNGRSGAHTLAGFPPGQPVRPPVRASSRRIRSPNVLGSILDAEFTGAGVG